MLKILLGEEGMLILGVTLKVIFGLIMLFGGLAHLLKIIRLDDFIIDVDGIPPSLRKIRSFGVGSLFVGLGIIMLSEVFHFYHVKVIRYISLFLMLPFPVISSCPLLWILLHALRGLIDFLLKYLDKLFE